MVDGDPKTPKDGYVNDSFNNDISFVSQLRDLKLFILIKIIATSKFSLSLVQQWRCRVAFCFTGFIVFLTFI